MLAALAEVLELVVAGTGRGEEDRVARLGLTPAPRKSFGQGLGGQAGKVRPLANDLLIERIADLAKEGRSGRQLGDRGGQGMEVASLSAPPARSQIGPGTDWRAAMADSGVVADESL